MNVLKLWLKRIYLVLKHRKKNVRFAGGAVVSLGSTLEGDNRIGKNTFFSGTMGRGSYMGEQCHIEAKIGRYCSIASRVVTVRGNHPTEKWASTHPAFFSTGKQCGITYVEENRFIEYKTGIVVGNDVWIGDSARIMDGVTIGDGAVVAAGAVVTKSVPPYAIVAGVPAKEIRKRFSENVIEQLMELKWWSKPEAWIRKNAACFEDAQLLLRVDGEEESGDMAYENL